MGIDQGASGALFDSITHGRPQLSVACIPPLCLDTLMCHFITLIVSTQEDEAVREIMKRHGRDATPIDNPSVRKVLASDERQYLTTAGHCDCGTVLAPNQDYAGNFEKELVHDVARMRRKRWSEAKIDRAIEGRRKAFAKPRGRGSDSFELWNAALQDIGNQLELAQVGLLIRFYSGGIATEVFKASRREVPAKTALLDALHSIADDEVTMFALR
jgi:hypothetical protein